MRLSIQGRLTMWYAGAWLAALTVCGLAVYAAIVNLEMASVDADLRRAASTAAFSMKAEAKEGLDLQAAASDTEGELSISGMAIALYDARGQLLAARWEGLEPVEHAPDSVLGTPETILAREAEWRRLVTRSAYTDSDYFVLSALPLAPVHRRAGQIRSILFAIIPISVAVAAACGWLLARRTLRPISMAHEAQRQFMADASHELRTPVSVIRSAADVTLSQPQRSVAEYQDSISVIAEQAKRLTRLVEDLFLLSRADVKARPLSTSRFYLDDVVAECVRAVEVLGAPKKIEFEMSTDKDIEVQADEDLVRRMLLNLLENAVRYNPPGTFVRVQLRRHRDQIDISITDNGPGVPLPDRERIFERFVRLEPKSATGAGLGLPIARWIAEAHGGSLVLAESSLGSVFVISLPL